MHGTPHIVSDVSDLCSAMAILHQGQVKLAGSPAAAIERIRGCVWEKTIEKKEQAAYRERYPVITTRLFGGRTSIHVFADARPDATFHEIAPDLEDVYFATMRGLVADGGC